MKKLQLLSLIFFLFPTILLAQDGVEIVIQSGHYDEIKALAFSPDGKHLASAGKDNKVIVWDLTTGKMFREMKGHENGVSGVIFSGDGNSLISGGDSRDKDLVVWDWRTGEIKLRIEKAASNSVEGFAVSKDGKWAVTGTYRELRVWDITTGDKVYEVNSKNSEGTNRFNHTVESIDFSPDGKRLAFGYHGGIAQVLEAATGKMIREINAKEKGGMTAAVAFSTNGKSLYTGGPRGKLIEWDLESGAVKKEFESPGGGSPCPCEFHPKEKVFYVMCSKDIVRFDLTTGQSVYELKDILWWRAQALAVSKNGKTIAAGGMDEDDNTSIRIFSAKSGQPIRSLTGYPGTILSLDFSPSGNYLAAGSQQRYARAWDLSTSKGFTNYSDGTWRDGDIFATVKFSMDGKRLFQGEQNNTFAWDFATAKSVGRIGYGGKNRHNIDVSRDGKHLATATGKVLIYDTKSLENKHNLPGPYLYIRSVAFSPDGKMLYSGGFKEIKRYDAMTFTEKDPLVIDDYAWSISPHPDGKVLAIQMWGEVHVIDAETAAKKHKLPEKNSLPRYSSDGKWLVTANGYDINVWSTSDYSRKHVLKGHKDMVNAFAFTPDGKYVASGSDDTSIILWDLEKGKQVVRLVALDKEDYIILTPDNYYMTSKNGVNGVCFRKGDKVYPFEQFDLYFNRPDIVLERIGYASQDLIDAYRRSYEKRLKKTGFKKEDLKFDFHLPEIELLNRDALGLESKSGKVNLEVKASDSKYPLDRLLVWINDVPVHGTKGLPVAGKKDLSKKLDLDLLPGANKIQVAALNKNGVESLKETIELRSVAASAKPKLFLIGIGVSEYQKSQYNLTYAAKDAKDMAETFGKSGAFSEVKTKLLLDEDATRDNIRGLSDFIAGANPQDIVMVFVAGHGLLDEQFDYYFATHDMDFDKPGLRGIEYGELEALLDGIRAIRKVLIMDTCHSGEVEKDELEKDHSTDVEKGAVVFRNVGVGVRKKDGMGAKNTSELMKELFTDLRRGTGATVISSAGGAEFAMESQEWNNGLFTYCLLHSLTGSHSDLDDDGNIHLSELQEYVITKVKELSAGKQIPTSRMENLSLDYHVW